MQLSKVLDALVEISRFFLDHKDLPMEGGESPHITAGIMLDKLNGAATNIPNLYGPSMSPAQLAELLCDCKIGRVLMGPDSQPLDVGREHRTAPRWMRRAIVARDKAADSRAAP